MDRAGSRRWAWLVGRVALGAVSLLVLSATGYVWAFYTDFDTGLTRSGALGSGEPKSKDGAVNILVMGLDSRLDQNGDPLPQAVYDQLHAGDNTNGGYNTNVMMVLHVPNDGSRSTLISIPRDDYAVLVGSPDGVSKEKIKQGYGLAKDAKQKQLAAQGVTDKRTLETQGRDAGRKQTVDDVRAFLGGIPVDHFVEVTLVGFYDLAQALGSITVCLRGPTQDSFSGAEFVKGVQQLNASQALAFVRQRRDYVHPELNFTDLDRERRQQAFLSSAAQQLKSAGTFADPAKLSRLIEAAKKDIVFDDQFDLATFVQQSSGLIDGGITYTTLPVKTFGQVNGEDVNLVDLTQIRTVVAGLIGDRNASATPLKLPKATVDVVNASGVSGLAGQLQTGLVAKGMTSGTARTNGTPLGDSVVHYGTGAAGAAETVADLLGMRVEQDSGTMAGHVRVVVGSDFVMPAVLTVAPRALSAPPSVSPAPASTAAALGASGNNDSGSPADSIQGGGVPCVK